MMIVIASLLNSKKYAVEKVNVQEESTVQNEPSIIVVGCVDVLCSYSSREVHFKLCCRVSEGFA